MEAGIPMYRERQNKMLSQAAALVAQAQRYSLKIGLTLLKGK
jgi:hypothetical protein